MWHRLLALLASLAADPAALDREPPRAAAAVAVAYAAQARGVPTPAPQPDPPEECWRRQRDGQDRPPGRPCDRLSLSTDVRVPEAQGGSFRLKVFGGAGSKGRRPTGPAGRDRRLP